MCMLGAVAHRAYAIVMYPLGLVAIANVAVHD